MNRRRWIWGWLAMLVAPVMGACAIGGASADTAAAASGPCGGAGGVAVVRHVVVIAFENHSYAQILGRAAPPSYFKQLAARCASAANFHAAFVPRSLPNYLAVTGGTTAGVTGDCLPAAGCSSGALSIFNQVGSNAWRVWAESMPRPCYRQNTSLYVPRHASAPYYRRLRASTCARNMLRLPTRPPQVKRRFVWVTPNLQHDLHNGTLSQASNWLYAFLAGRGGVFHSRGYQTGHTAVFVWFDSPGGSGSIRTPIPLIVASRHLKHRIVTRPLDDYSLLHGWQGLLGLGCHLFSCTHSGLNAGFHL
jgi:hypothetical protein